MRLRRSRRRRIQKIEMLIGSSVVSTNVTRILMTQHDKSTHNSNGNDTNNKNSKQENKINKRHAEQMKNQHRHFANDS